MYLLKSLLLPSSLIALVLVIALVLLLLPRVRRLSYALFGLGAVLYLVFSSGWTAAALLAPLEYRYDYLKSTADYPDVDTIVVLTAYVASDPLMPVSTRFNSSTLFRIVEAHNIYTQCDQCRIIVSGTDSYARLMQQQFLMLGVPADRVSVDGVSGHTVDSAESLNGKVDGKRFFLVTSAGHMVRSVGVFEKQGFEPIPAPTDYSMPRDFTRAPIWPASLHLLYSDLAVNEYGGILWYRFSGRMD